MKVRFEIDIKESAEELKRMFRGEKDGRRKERIHVIWLLKTGICRNIKELTLKVPRDRNTVGTWLKKYRSGGMELLCRRKISSGRKPVIPDAVTGRLAEKLSDPEGFGSYREISEWVERETGKKISTKTVYHVCHYRLKAVSSVPRPCNPEKNDETVRIFRENFSEDIKKN